MAKDMNTGYRETLYAQYRTSSGRAQESELAIADLNDSYAGYVSDVITKLTQMPKASNCLDIGCGHGGLVWALRKYGFSGVTGVDVSAEQVKAAHDLGVPGVHEADVFEFLGRAERAYDIITGLDIIEHFTKSEVVQLLELVKLSLRPGGCCLFRTPNGDAPFSSVFALGDFTHETILNYASAMQLFKSTRFADVRVTGASFRVRAGWKRLILPLAYSAMKLMAMAGVWSYGLGLRKTLFSSNMIIVART